ncbi:hypothetical protein HPB48_006542 [Haemaphysalis longicornis]|uniref:Uncharacterized protein n=1 Tax=Haemaphysalis longicornis TaxID=44386 RepID=A0A9J6GAG7_HAELO|nr:hypothetical protein HPB48_006542 [Haemaphysalis longicornis]
MLAQLTCLLVLPPLEERLLYLDWDRELDREFLRNQEEEPRRTVVFPILRRRRPCVVAGCCWSPGAWGLRSGSFCRLTHGHPNRCWQTIDSVRCSPLHRKQQDLRTWPGFTELAYGVPLRLPWTFLSSPTSDITSSDPIDLVVGFGALRPSPAAHHAYSFRFKYSAACTHAFLGDEIVPVPL